MMDLVVGNVSVIHRGWGPGVNRAGRKGGSAAATPVCRKTQQHSKPGSPENAAAQQAAHALCAAGL
jgi:hypothetical protein